jgi:hypothetical protein
MARDGSGNYNRAVAPYVAGTTITAATVNSEMEDIATALTGSLSRDGQSPPTANIPMGGFRLTGLGNAIANTDAAALGQVTSYALAKAGDTATGALGVIAGTAAAPGVFVVGDTNTGLFQPAADMLAVTVGGAEVARFGANGLQSASPWVDLASAATTDLGAQTTDNLRITGTTTITSFGTAANGVTRNLRFAAALTLTHNATSLILPGGANITTAAGDTAIAISLGSGNWVVVNYMPAGGYARAGAAAGSGLILATARLLGRLAAGTGAIEEIPIANPVAAFSIGINRGTEQVISGTPVNVDFLNIPAGVRQIVVGLSNVGTNGTSPVIIQLGSGSFLTSGYFAGSTRFGASTLSGINITAGIAGWNHFSAADAIHGLIDLNATTNLIWGAHGGGYVSSTDRWSTGGSVTLSGTLARLRITTVNGTDTFDAGGIINVSWSF